MSKDYEDYDDDLADKIEERRPRRKRRRKWSSNAKWGVALILELIVIMLLGYGILRVYLHQKYAKFDHVNDMSEEELEINEGANEEMAGYTNIALFGIDARDNNLEKGSRSDAIIIASINNDTKSIRLLSVYRDTLLQVKKTDGTTVTTKVNAAYAYGGPELALQTLNQNLDLNISEYVVVNWEGLTRAIDALGGVTVHIEENELDTLNGVLAEQIMVNGINSDGVYETGYVTLNGAQATAYSRIRSTDQGDITRTERQREVIQGMIEKAKHSDLATLNTIIDEVFPYIGTSITEDQMYDLAKGVISYNLESSTGFPLKWEYYSSGSKGSCIAPVDLNENVITMQQFLFGTEGYTPTAGVQDISAAISAETGFASQGAIPLPEQPAEEGEE
ncbi:transcriptional attenuator, LytR family [Lachnospiraceae bacterium NE2001]|nr:transcriptional attenuator, LytR family [Lachnospiraceae bacterium NE2001]